MRRSVLVGVAIAVVSFSAGVIAARAQTATSITRSTTFDWTRLDERPVDVGTRRAVMRSATPTLDELEIHITTLKPGAVSHPPHQHPEEELLIVKEGQVETFQNGKVTRLGPGSIIFHSSNDLHNISNVGTTPATYHVVQWRVAARP